MAFTYDITTLRGQVRRLINDVYSADPIFDDAEIDFFLAAEINSLKRAAALAYETIARDEVLVSKVVKTLQLSTDGAKVSAEMRQHAQMLRDQAENDIVADSAPFEIAEWALPPFGTVERIYKQAAREADY